MNDDRRIPPISEQEEWFRHRNAMRPFWSVVICLYFFVFILAVAVWAWLLVDSFMEMQNILEKYRGMK